jgi:hypothetical protein
MNDLGDLGVHMPSVGVKGTASLVLAEFVLETRV